MSLSDKNLDQLFKEAANTSPKVSYQDSYWDEMNAILNAEDQKKKKYWFWIAGGSVAAIALVSLLFSTNSSTVQYSSANTLDFELTDSEILEMEAIKRESNLLWNVSDYQQTTNVKNITPKNSRNNFLTNLNPENTQISSIANLSVNDVNISSTSVEIVNQELSNDIYNLTTTLDEDNKTTPLNKEINLLTTKDLSVTFDNSSQLISPRLPKVQNGVYAQLNLGMSERYTDNSAGIPLMLDAMLGYEVNRNKISLRAGIGGSISTNSGISFSDRSKVYNFGSRSYTHEVTYGNLYELYIPLEIGVKLNRTTFGAGLKANYLVHTNLEFRSKENENTVLSEDFEGITEGLNKTTFNGYVFLDRRFSPRLSVGAKVGTTLTSRINEETYFDLGDNSKNPLFGQVYLKFNFKK